MPSFAIRSYNITTRLESKFSTVSINLEKIATVSYYNTIGRYHAIVMRSTDRHRRIIGRLPTRNAVRRSFARFCIVFY